jgi:hypothetical protein
VLVLVLVLVLVVVRVVVRPFDVACRRVSHAAEGNAPRHSPVRPRQRIARTRRFHFEVRVNGRPVDPLAYL